MTAEKSPNVPPFVQFCTASVPMVFDNSMSYYECLCALTKFIQGLVNTVNYNATQLDGLLEGFKELKDYVDNYFANLDVQEEINNKLDEMAEGGQLAGIIAQFLSAAPVFAYGTIAEMAAASNLSNGCIARVLGNTTATDGDGAYYIIRTRVEADDPDGVNLVAIGDTLVGVRVTDAGYNTLNTSVTNLNNRLNLIENKKYVFIGDSYLQGYTSGGTIENWGVKVASILGLSSGQYSIVAYGGSGFIREDTKTFTQMVSELSADDDVTDVVLCGGYNDIGAGFSTLLPYMTSFKAAVASKFSNAKISVGFIGGTTNGDNIYQLSVTAAGYKKGCARLGLNYLKNVEYCLKNYYTDFTSDTIHPNNYGQQSIADAVAEAIISGAADIQLDFASINITPSRALWTVDNGNFGCTVNNNITTLHLQGIMNFSANTGATLDMICDGRGYELGTVTSGYVVGVPSQNCALPVNCVIGYADGYAQAQGKLVISNSSVALFLYNTNALINATNFMSLSGVYMIQIQSALNTCDSSLC